MIGEVMPGAFQPWNWFNNSAPTPEQVSITRNQLIHMRDEMAKQRPEFTPWVMVLQAAINHLTFYAERERRN